MIRKRLTVLLGCCLWLTLAWTQTDSSDAVETERIDVIHLKNGQVHRGKIVRYERGKLLSLARVQGDTLLVSDRNVLRIVQKAGSDAQQESRTTRNGYEQSDTAYYLRLREPPAYAFRERGFYDVLQFSLFNGRSDDDFKFGVGISNVVGYRIRPELGFGIGVGLDNYAVGSGQVVYPVFVEYRGYFSRKWRAPYVVVAGGYSFAFENLDAQVLEAEGGYMLHPAVGLRMSGAKGANVLVDLGFKVQKARFLINNISRAEVEDRDVTYRRLVLRVSLAF